MDPRYGGESASYYGEQPNPHYPHPSGLEREEGYGHPHNPQYENGYGPATGNQYDGHQQYQPHYQNEGVDGERGLMGGLAGAAAGAYGGHKMGHGVIGAIGGAVAGHKLQDYVHDRKEKKEEEERLQQQLHSGPPPPSYSPGPQYPHHGGHHSPGQDRSIGGHGGNFSSSSHDVHLEGDYDLRANCRRRDGGSQVSILNLNGILSNVDGHFRWAAAGSGPSSIIVQQGDTLRSIAQRYNCNFNEIVGVNNITNPDMIYPGQTLRVPGQPVGNFSSSARDIRLVDRGRFLEAELLDTSGNWHRRRIDLDERIGNEDGSLRFV
ncbi:carbohydrate-binding module family 50 protein [Jackrogersella minutella]|nr:carbohydrate-binding module family 50 protein [Jackrogersella minutella]